MSRLELGFYSGEMYKHGFLSLLPDVRGSEAQNSTARDFFEII